MALDLAYIVKEAIENLNGSITVCSEVAGTTFIVTIPENMKQNYKILIVDDNVIDQLLQNNFLKKKLNMETPFRLLVGKEALELTNYKENNDFLVILDIKMPKWTVLNS
jgi:hypothetical protein